ncbi:MAG TPA: hypothetical protein VD926_04695, partial [Acidimicrobiales bacterium]|nr:hypothetical protein [Acidimicrobiales bacterium]
MTCTDARLRVSERLDGDVVVGLDEHLAGCADCRRFADSAAGLRRALRFEPVGEVPDLAPAVRARLEEPAPPVDLDERRARRRDRSTLAVAVAALVAGVLIGVNLVGVGGNGPSPAVAAPLPQRVAAAQSRVDGLHEDLRLVERGWHPAVPERTYEGTLDYRAPESLALQWRDTTTYPSGAWRPNDVSLRTDGERWSATGVPECPATAQPGCTLAPQESAVTARTPFADGAPVPLEVIVPVQSFSRLDTASVVGEGEVAGRPTVEVDVVAAQVGPLLDGLAPEGNLRSVHPTDHVRLSLDADRMVPLALAVTASDDPDRPAWASRRGYADRAGLVVLELLATAVDFEEPPADLFVPPAAPDAADVGFRPGEPQTGLDPAAPDGFEPSRTGRVEGATPTDVWSWTDGRAWIRLQATTAWAGPGLFGDLGPLVRPEPLGGGEAYARPDGRRVALHAEGLDLVVDGSVGTEALLQVLQELDVAPAPLPDGWPERRTASQAAIRAAVP